MSGPLAEALEADARAGRALVAHLDGVLARATVRVRRRRRRRLAWGGATVMAAIVAVALLAPPPADPLAGPQTPPSEPPASSPPALDLTAPLTADQLRGTMRPRERGDGGREAQEALVCGTTSVPDDPLTPCAAIWAAERPLVSLDVQMATPTALVSSTSARIEVYWLLENVSGRPLLLDRGDATVVLTTDPGGLEDGVTTLQKVAWGRSLWLDETRRLARDTPVERVERIEPREYMTGQAEFEVRAPLPGETPDPLWLIATGQADATLTVQLGIASEDPDAEAALILESSGALGALRPALTADELARSFAPRAQGEAADGSRQAALLCPVPDSLQVSTFTNPDVPYAARPVDCEAGWVDGPVVAAERPMILYPEERGVGVEWTVSNVADRALYITQTHLVVEAQPEATSSEDLQLVGSTVATRASAWRGPGTRAAWIDNVSLGFAWEPTASLATGDALLGSGVEAQDGSGADWLLSAVYEPGAVTVQVSAPFLEDPSRVLILEIPMTVEDSERG